MDVVLVVPVRARPQHRRKPRAGRMQHVLAQLPRHGAVGQRDRAAIGKLEGADIERIGAAVFGKQGTGNAVAAAALEGVEIVEVARSCCRAFAPAARYRCGSSRRSQTPCGNGGLPLASPTPAVCRAARSPPAAPDPRRRSRRDHGCRECWERWRSPPSAPAGTPKAAARAPPAHRVWRSRPAPVSRPRAALGRLSAPPPGAASATAPPCGARCPAALATVLIRTGRPTGPARTGAPPSPARPACRTKWLRR